MRLAWLIAAAGIAFFAVLAARSQPPMPVAPKRVLHAANQVKGATKTMVGAKASLLAVIVQPPKTNYCTLVFNNELRADGLTNAFYPAFWIKSTSDLKRGMTNIMNFPSGTQSISQGFSFVGNRFFAISYQP